MKTLNFITNNEISTVLFRYFYSFYSNKLETGPDIEWSRIYGILLSLVISWFNAFHKEYATWGEKYYFDLCCASRSDQITSKEAPN